MFSNEGFFFNGFCKFEVILIILYLNCYGLYRYVKNFVVGEKCGKFVKIVMCEIGLFLIG